MKFDLRKELPIIIIALLPAIYLAMIWEALPDKVPLHWNLRGEIDRWGSKNELLLIPFILPIPTYLLMTVVPYLDPKKKLELMGGKFQQLKFLITLSMSALAIFLLYIAKNQTAESLHLIFALLGLFFAGLGNFLQSIKPNYFIGIRTPWTLENDQVWRDTHRFAGIIWIAGGISIVFLSFYLEKSPDTLLTLFFVVVGILALVPIVHSYFRFKELDKTV